MNEIRYDHENIQSIASALHEQASRIRTDAREGARAALDEIVAESSRYTRSGGPAPIFRETVAQARAALDAVVAKAGALADGMDRHADVLSAGVSGAQTIEAESAAAMSAVDTDTGVTTTKPVSVTDAGVGYVHSAAEFEAAGLTPGTTTTKPYTPLV